jgi:hypothetical protein
MNAHSFSFVCLMFCLAVYSSGIFKYQPNEVERVRVSWVIFLRRITELNFDAPVHPANKFLSPFNVRSALCEAVKKE